MLFPFRAVLARPGARILVLVSLLGWFSSIGTPLAVVLAVHHATGSFSLAGVASATQAVGSAVFAPIRGRLVDRRGGPALLTLAGGLAAGAGLLTWGCLAHLDEALFGGTALLGSCTLPLIGVARSRWPQVAGPEFALTAHALNAAISDCAQLAAPALVAGISIVVSPIGSVITLVLGACFAAAILASGSLPRHGPQTTRTRRDLLGVLRGNPGLQAIVVGDIAMGAWTAGMAIVVIAIASHHGDASLGGLLLAAGALGSIVMSLMAGTGALKTSPANRYVTGAGLSVVGLAALLLLSSLPGVTAALIVIGAGLGLENVAVFEALDLVSPRGRSTEAFTWLTTASAAGTALGAALSGRLVEQSSSAARLFLLAVALVGLLVVAARRQAFGAPIAAREHDEHGPPGP